jgi:hypothetical protein
MKTLSIIGPHATRLTDAMGFLPAVQARRAPKTLLLSQLTLPILTSLINQRTVTS